MSIKEKLSSQYDKTAIAHLFVIVVLIVDILFFTQQTFSIIIQIFLIIAVWFHYKNDKTVKKNMQILNQNLINDKEIFDRNVIVSETDINGRITYVNKKFCDISGYTKDELIGNSHNIIKSQETPSMFFKDLWKTIKSGKTFQAKIKNIKKDGTPYWVDSSISPILMDSKVVGYKSIRFDITEQVLSQMHLKDEIDLKENLLIKQSNRFEFAINSSRDGFWDYDLLNKEFYLSRGWKKRIGFKEDEEISYLDYLSLIPDENRFEHHHAMHDMLESYKGDIDYVHFRVRYPLITKNAEKLVIEDVGDAFFDENHTLTRITGFHRDITEQERQAKILESQNRVAEMGEMISNIAHQWRQPISAINNVLNDVEFDIELEELEKVDKEIFLQASTKVKEYTKYLSQTIDDFRNISSDEKTKTDFYIKLVVNEAYKIVHSSYEKNHIKCQIIEFGEHTYEFNGYQRELVQVIINILNNAKDILIEKEISEPRVLITLTQKADEAIIIIHDNGGGIPESLIEKVFDPYFTTKHESVGTGIGLYMSKKIITQYFNGTLFVENENGGAKFIINIPREV